MNKAKQAELAKCSGQRHRPWRCTVVGGIGLFATDSKQRMCCPQGFQPEPCDLPASHQPLGLVDYDFGKDFCRDCPNILDPRTSNHTRLGVHCIGVTVLLSSSS